MNFDTWYDLYAHPLEPRKDAAKRYAEEQGVDDPAEKQGFLDSISEYQYADPVTTEYDTGFGDWTPPEPPPPTTSIDYEDDPSFFDSLGRGFDLAHASAYGIAEGMGAGFLDDLGFEDASKGLKDWAKEGRLEQEAQAATVAPAKTIKEELAADPDSWYKYFDEDMMTMGQVAEAAPTSLAPFAAALPLALATPYLTSAAGIAATGSLASKLIAGGVAMGTGNVASSAFVASEAYERGKEDKIIRKQLKVDPDKKFEDLVPSDQQKIDKVATDLSQTSFGHRLYTSGLVEMASYIPYGHAMLRLALDTGLGTASEVWDRTLYSEDAVEALIENGVPAEKADELRNAIIDAGPSFRQTLISALQQEFMMGGAATGIESLIGKTPPQVNAPATASKKLNEKINDAVKFEENFKTKKIADDNQRTRDELRALTQAEQGQRKFEQNLYLENLKTYNKSIEKEAEAEARKREISLLPEVVPETTTTPTYEDIQELEGEQEAFTESLVDQQAEPYRSIAKEKEMEARGAPDYLPVSIADLKKYRKDIVAQMATAKEGSDLKLAAQRRIKEVDAKIEELRPKLKTAEEIQAERIEDRNRESFIKKEKRVLNNIAKKIYGVKGEEAVDRTFWNQERFVEERFYKKRKLELQHKEELAQISRNKYQKETDIQIQRRRDIQEEALRKQAEDIVDNTIKPSAIKSDGNFNLNRQFIQEYVDDLGNNNENYKGIFTILDNKSVPDLANILIRTKYLETKGKSAQEVRAEAETLAEKLLSENNAWVMGDHVYVNADNVKGANKKDALTNLVKIVTFHEPIAHLGLKRFLGAEYIPFLNNFFNTNKEFIKDWAENEAITDQGDAAYLEGKDFNDLSESQQRDLAEEFLANKFVEMGILDPDIISRTADSLLSSLKGVLTPSRKRVSITEARSVLAEIQRQYLGGKKNIITGDFFDPANWTMKGIEVEAGEDKVAAYRRYLKEQGIIIERGEKDFIKKEFAPRPTEPKTVSGLGAIRRKSTLQKAIDATPQDELKQKGEDKKSPTRLTEKRQSQSQLLRIKAEEKKIKKENKEIKKEQEKKKPKAIIGDLPDVIYASKRILTPRQAEVWKAKNKIGKGRKKRFPELQTLAKKLEKGEVSYEDYQNKADELIPIKRFNSVPKAATDEEILGSIKKDQYKDGLILGEENLKSGKDVVDVRLDIPAYETYDTWVATIKHGGKNIYGGAVRLKDVTFKAPQMGALRIAQGANKYPLATMKGTWQKNSVADIEKMAKDYINDPNWVQIGYNPERQSSFYIREDKNGEIKGTPLESADEIIQVGAFILAKNPTTKAVPESQVRFSKQPLSNEEIATKYSLPISKSIKDSLPDEAVMLSPIGKIEYIRTIESGSLVGSIKFSKKMLGNLDAKTSKELQKKLMGKNIVALVGDRLKRGDYIPMHGNKSENKEVMEKLHGGPEYAFDLTNIGKLGRAAWASGAGRITVIANALKELKTNIGSIIVGSPEQHMSNMDFWNVVWGETLDASKLGTFDKDGNLKKDKDGNIKKLDINWLNSYIAGKGKLNKDGSLQKNTKPLTELTYETKEQDPKDKNKEITVINDLIPKKLKSKVTDFNSLMSIGEQLPFKARKEILVKLFGDPSKNTVKHIMSRANGIDITEIIKRTSAYPDAEVGDMVGIVEFDIDKNGEAIVGEAKDMDITPHPSYPTVIMGRAIAKYEKSIPMEKWGRDWLTAKRYNKEGPTGQRPFFPKKKQKKFEKTYFYTDAYLKVIRGETDKIPSKKRTDIKSPAGVRALAKRTIEMAPGQRKLKVTEGMFPEYNIDGSIKASKRLYHGSPETFDKFSMDKIGTKGVQVHGWGMYFTNDKSIAETYASQVPEGWAKKDIKKRVYEVTLAPKENEYLNLRKPLRTQSRVVKKGISKILKTLSPDSPLKRWFKLNTSKMTGNQFYNWVKYTFASRNRDFSMASEKKASLYLLSKGIRGNKIDDTRVIFSEGDIKIDAMYSKRLATAKKLEAEWRANILKVENAPPPIRIVDKVSISKEARDILNAKPTKEDLNPKGILHPDGNIKASKVLASRASSFALKTKDIGKKLPLRYRIAEKLTRRITPQGTLPDRLRWLAIRRLVKGEITGIEDASRNLYNILKNTKQADVIYKYFTTRDFDANKITNKIERKAAIKAKETIDNIGDQLVKNDLLEKGARDQLKGMYLPQVYLKYLLKDDNAFVRVRGGGGIQIDQSYLKQRLPEEKLPKEIRELILGQIKDPAYLSSKAISVPAKDMAILNWLQQIAGNENWVAKDTLVNFDTLAEIKNINLPLKIKKELEFKDTAGVKVSSHWLKNESERIWGMTKFMDLSKGEIEVIQELTNKMGKVADSANNNYDPKLFTQVPKTKKYGMLAGMAVRKEIAQDIFGGMNMTTGEPSIAENILGDTGYLGSFNRFWKWSKVSANPPSWVRNFVSNMILMNMSGVPFYRMPDLILSSLKDMRKRGKDQGKLHQLAKDLGLTTGNFSNVELARIEREFKDLQNRLKNKKAGSMSVIGMIKGAFNKVQDSTSDFYGGIDTLGKMMVLKYNLDKNKLKVKDLSDYSKKEMVNIDDIAYSAEKWLFDYSNVLPSVKYLRNVPFGAPFASFTSFVGPLMLETAITKPWKFLPYYALGWAMKEMFKDEFDLDEEQYEGFKVSMSDYLREKAYGSFFPRAVIPFPFLDENKRIQFMDISYLYPWGMFSEVAGEISEGEIGQAIKTAGLLGSPGLNIASAIMTGIDPFTRKEIVDETGTPSEKAADLLWYAFNLSAPPMLHGVFQGPNQGFGAVKRLKDAFSGNLGKDGEAKFTKGQALGRMVGMNITPIAVPEGRNKQLRYEYSQLKKIEYRARREITNMIMMQMAMSDIKKEAKKWGEKLNSEREKFVKKLKISVPPMKLLLARERFLRQKATKARDYLSSIQVQEVS